MDTENGRRLSPSGISYTPPAPAKPPEPAHSASAPEPEELARESGWSWDWKWWLLVAFVILPIVRYLAH